MKRDDSSLREVFNYHERTKHSPRGFARSLGYLDWDNQPDPFRRYNGAQLILLDEIPPGKSPQYPSLFRRGSVPPTSLDRFSLSQLFYDSLALSAWKSHGRSSWSLRVNPSSGNLHPTEAYLIAGPISGLIENPMICHYSPFVHALENRLTLPEQIWTDITAQLPPSSFLIGLTSIHWRESWKYGERAFRYCQHDIGHAIAAVALAAAALGWNVDMLESLTDEDIAVLLKIDGQEGPEAEHPECLMVVYPADEEFPAGKMAALRIHDEIIESLRNTEGNGTPNRLSPGHVEWPVIDAVAQASSKKSPPKADFWWINARVVEHKKTHHEHSGRMIIRQRRSAVAMDRHSSIGSDAFYELLSRLLPAAGGVPFDTVPWRPLIHLLLFVHRVEGLAPGLYFLCREESMQSRLQVAFREDFIWTKPQACPGHLAFYLLEEGDVRRTAQTLSCNQEIASDGAFAVAMIADFRKAIGEFGPWLYKRLHWEAGALGQVLYLEAEAAGLSGTGIGCFFDDLVHEMLDLRDTEFQSIYHFTVGRAVDDPRISTLEGYTHRKAVLKSYYGIE